MSAANPLPDTALQPEPEPSDSEQEPSRPTQPWNAPPALLDWADDFESDFEVEPEAGATGFDLHDTIPAPPWLDEPADSLEVPLLTAR